MRHAQNITVTYSHTPVLVTLDNNPSLGPKRVEEISPELVVYPNPQGIVFAPLLDIDCRPVVPHLLHVGLPVLPQVVFHAHVARRPDIHLQNARAFQILDAMRHYILGTVWYST